MQFYYAGTEEMQVDHANMMRQFLLVTGLPLILRKDVEINKNVNIIFECFYSDISDLLY